VQIIIIMAYGHASLVPLILHGKTADAATTDEVATGGVA
jgi:hypothetical protein